MDEFQKRYDKLNSAQKKAVNLIEGPALVIAGPGTGKTELLSLRIANILKSTDTLPQNILCLTYTDSGVTALRERLIGIIGRDAYKVAIHTFHSFGSEVINQNSEFFYNNAILSHADELKKTEIITEILENLPPRDALASKFNDKFAFQRDIIQAISHIKNSGFTSGELISILDQNNLLIDKVNQVFPSILNVPKISTQIIPGLEEGLQITSLLQDKPPVDTIPALSQIFCNSLQNAIEESREAGKATPLKNWRDKWFEKDSTNGFILKDTKRQQKLRSLANIYDQYLKEMNKQELYDFDDMILEVIHAMEIYDDLRFNLQEKYQYVMVDEFQDTNLSQMRILRNLTNNEVQEETPNIMIVGDDDQAIYSFQGADSSNILTFRKLYPRAEIIVLKENYRSTSEILAGSREIITQGVERLENTVEVIDKELIARAKHDSGYVSIYQAPTIQDERSWIAKSIKQALKSGESANQIAVLVRNHREVEPLLSYFTAHKIPVTYDRKDNVLELDPIKILEQLASLIIALSDNELDTVNALLPKILAHPMWGISSQEIWKISLNSYKSHKHWLETIADNEAIAEIQQWLSKAAADINNLSLEESIDLITGVNGEEGLYRSPFYNFFFSPEKLKLEPENYLIYLDALTTIRARLRDYQGNKTLTLKDFIKFIDLNRRNEIIISSHRQISSSPDAVNVMTAHKSKGLEFDTVYIFNAVDSTWGTTARKHSERISFPENLNFKPAGETDDEKLRLFYVAATRARKNLHISYSLKNDANKNTLSVSCISGSKLWPTAKIDEAKDLASITETAEINWYQDLIQPKNDNLRELLQPILDNYSLSPTHLNSFVDLTNGGPQGFLLNQLLHFPSAKSPNASYGTAIHLTLQQAHAYVVEAGNYQPIEDILGNFEKNLLSQQLSKPDFTKFLNQGIETLRVFLESKYKSFGTSQQVELDFSHQEVYIDQAHITGKLDLVDIDKQQKTISVTDYKTGKPAGRWAASDVRLHKYRQQLLFYKLLIENSRDWQNLTVQDCIMQFVEPDSRGEIISLSADFARDEVENFKHLIIAVYNHIVTLNLPDTDKYPKSIKGVQEFENDLIEGSI